MDGFALGTALERVVVRWIIDVVRGPLLHASALRSGYIPVLIPFCIGRIHESPSPVKTIARYF